MDRPVGSAGHIRCAAATVGAADDACYHGDRSRRAVVRGLFASKRRRYKKPPALQQPPSSAARASRLKRDSITPRRRRRHTVVEYISGCSDPAAARFRGRRTNGDDLQAAVTQKWPRRLRNDRNRSFFYRVGHWFIFADPIQSNPSHGWIQSNPSHGWIQSRSNSVLPVFRAVFVIPSTFRHVIRHAVYCWTADTENRNTRCSKLSFRAELSGWMSRPPPKWRTLHRKGR